MIVEDQEATRVFLADAMAADAGSAPAAGAVETVETHISHVVIGPERVWKLKRAVRLPYADFSTAERRLAACEREVALNARTAPRHYLGVRRITRQDGRLALDGDGPLVDAVVEMRRFDQAMLLDRLAAAGRLDAPLMEALAGAIARLHAEAPAVREPAGSAHVAGVLAINEAALAETTIFPPEDVSCFNARFRAAAARHAAQFDARGREGRVRRCHGDLHLRNIFLDDGAPVIFDCIEFNDAIATVDVLYDLAFLLMDLVQRNLGALANAVMNRYLDATGDEGGLALVPFFMALRAAVRAHVTATAIEAGDGRPETRAAARAYFDLAETLLEPRPVTLVAIGGLSGSGKSTVAAALAPRLGPGAGARLLSSDRLRKAAFGVAPAAMLPPEAYAPEVSVQVYAALEARAAALVGSGVPVVADAVFARPDERRRIAAAAAAARVPFRGYWLAVAPELLRDRVAGRSAGRKGPSDADLAVLERQLGYDLGPMDWTRIDGSGTPEEVVALIAGDLPGPVEASRELTAGRSCG